MKAPHVLLAGFLVLPLALVVAASPEVAPDSRAIHLRGGLAGFAKRAEAGEKLRVASLGGSITENGGGHSKRIPDWLRARFPKAEIESTNAGIGSTCSTSGAFRVHDHILAAGKLDLLVVEFAVNDDQDATHPREICIRGMEGIIRRVLAHNPDCGILMVQYVNPGMLAKTAKGETPVSIAAHETVAEHYNIPSVDVALELADAEKAGRFTWKDYGGTHPRPAGYEFATNLATSALEQLFARPSKRGKLPAPIDPKSYDKGRFVAPSEAELGEGWVTGHPVRDLIPQGGLRQTYFSWPMARATKPGTSLKFAFEGQSVGAFVLAGPDAGIVETRIDGGEWVETDLFHRFSKGLNYPMSVVFASGLEAGEHVLELRVAEKKNPGSKGTAATLLYLLVDE